MKQEMRFNRMKKMSVLLGFCATLLLGAMSQTSYAFSYSVNPYPDINLVGLSTQYNTTTGSFTSSAWAENFYGSVSSSTVLNYATFNLSALISTSGLIGNFSIVDSDSDTNYLSGILTAKDFSESTTYQFLFNPTSGLYKDAYNLAGTGYINLSSNPNFLTGDVKTVAAPVPEPSTVVLMLLGVGGLFCARRRNSVA
jgi:hypothetical protein